MVYYFYFLSFRFLLLCSLLGVGIPIGLWYPLLFCGLYLFLMISFYSWSYQLYWLSCMFILFVWLFIALPIYGILKNLKPLTLQLRFYESVSLAIIDFKGPQVFFSLISILRLIFIGSSLSGLVTFSGPSALRLYPVGFH